MNAMRRPYPRMVREREEHRPAAAPPPLTMTITRPVHWMEHRVRWCLMKSADGRSVTAEVTFAAYPGLSFFATATHAREAWKPAMTPSEARHETNECQHEAFGQIIRDVNAYNQGVLAARREG